jgi:hypothetical protein
VSGVEDGSEGPLGENAEGQVESTEKTDVVNIKEAESVTEQPLLDRPSTLIERLTLYGVVVTAIGVVFTAVALVLTIFQNIEARDNFKRSQTLERELQAYETWEKHLERSMEHDELAVGMDGMPTDKKLRQQYIWFVESMLISSEQVLKADPGDVQWQHAIMYEVRNNRGYILSDDFVSPDGSLLSSYCTYEKKLRDIIRKSFDDAVASNRLSGAEVGCSQMLTKLGKPNA